MIGSYATMYVPDFIKTDSGNQMLIEGIHKDADTQTHSHTDNMEIT